MAIVVTQSAHDVRPNPCGILVEDGIGICWNGKPGSGLHFRLQLAWAPSGISDIGAKGLASLTSSQNTINEVRIPAETDPVENMMGILRELIQSIQHHDLVRLHRPSREENMPLPFEDRYLW